MRTALRGVTILLLFGFATLAAFGQPAPPGVAPSTQPVAGKTGEFEVCFTERAPGNTYAQINARLADKDNGPDYDLAKKPFMVYVPPDYSGKTPFGIVLYMSTGSADQTPATLHPVCDKRHLIYIVAKTPNLTLAEELGLSIDAVYNLKRLYSVDARRVYLMGHDWAEHTGMSAPDVFMGGVYIWNIGYWRNIQLPDGSRRYYPGSGGPPMASLLPLTKKRVQVMGYETDNYNDGIRSLIPGAMKQDGFEHVFPVVIAGGDDTTPEWFGKRLDILESVPVEQTHPATQPAPNPAAALLRLAQSYVAAGRNDLARAKLDTLIEKYPHDPAAAKAKELLSQIDGDQEGKN